MINDKEIKIITNITALASAVLTTITVITTIYVMVYGEGTLEDRYFHIGTILGPFLVYSVIILAGVYVPIIIKALMRGMK